MRDAGALHFIFLAASFLPAYSKKITLLAFGARFASLPVRCSISLSATHWNTQRYYTMREIEMQISGFHWNLFISAGHSRSSLDCLFDNASLLHRLFKLCERLEYYTAVQSAPLRVKIVVKRVCKDSIGWARVHDGERLDRAHAVALWQLSTSRRMRGGECPRAGTCPCRTTRREAVVRTDVTGVCWRPRAC